MNLENAIKTDCRRPVLTGDGQNCISRVAGILGVREDEVSVSVCPSGDEKKILQRLSSYRVDLNFRLAQLAARGFFDGGILARVFAGSNGLNHYEGQALLKSEIMRTLWVNSSPARACILSLPDGLGFPVNPGRFSASGEKVSEDSPDFSAKAREFFVDEMGLTPWLEVNFSEKSGYPMEFSRKRNVLKVHEAFRETDFNEILPVLRFLSWTWLESEKIEEGSPVAVRSAVFARAIAGFARSSAASADMLESGLRVFSRAGFEYPGLARIPSVIRGAVGKNPAAFNATGHQAEADSLAAVRGILSESEGKMPAIVHVISDYLKHGITDRDFEKRNSETVSAMESENKAKASLEETRDRHEEKWGPIERLKTTVERLLKRLQVEEERIERDRRILKPCKISITHWRLDKARLTTMYTGHTVRVMFRLKAARKRQEEFKQELKTAREELKEATKGFDGSQQLQSIIDQTGHVNGLQEVRRSAQRKMAAFAQIRKLSLEGVSGEAVDTSLRTFLRHASTSMFDSLPGEKLSIPEQDFNSILAQAAVSSVVREMSLPFIPGETPFFSDIRRSFLGIRDVSEIANRLLISDFLKLTGLKTQPDGEEALEIHRMLKQCPGFIHALKKRGSLFELSRSEPFKKGAIQLLCKSAESGSSWPLTEEIIQKWGSSLLEEQGAALLLCDKYPVQLSRSMGKMAEEIFSLTWIPEAAIPALVSLLSSDCPGFDREAFRKKLLLKHAWKVLKGELFGDPAVTDLFRHIILKKGQAGISAPVFESLAEESISQQVYEAGLKSCLESSGDREDLINRIIVPRAERISALLLKSGDARWLELLKLCPPDKFHALFLNMINTDPGGFKTALSRMPSEAVRQIVNSLPDDPRKALAKCLSKEEMGGLGVHLSRDEFKNLSYQQDAKGMAFHRDLYLHRSARGWEEIELAEPPVGAPWLTQDGLGINYYYFLGVPLRADEDTLKNSYRKLVFLFHPDRLKEESQSVKDECDGLHKAITEAWEVLSDREKRKQYNKCLPVDAALFPKKPWWI